MCVFSFSVLFVLFGIVGIISRLELEPYNTLQTSKTHRNREDPFFVFTFSDIESKYGVCQEKLALH